MKTRRPPHLLAATVLVASLILAACGGGSGEAPPENLASVNIDTTGPTVTITDDVAATTANGNVTFRFTFNKDVGTSFTADDITVSGGTKGTFARIDGKSATLVVIPTPNSNGTIQVSVAAGAVTDALGNSSAAASSQQAFETVVRTQMSLPVGFNAADVNHGVVGFGGAEDSSIVADPTDATNKVVKVVRAAQAEPFAGTTITAVNSANVQTGLAPKIPFNVTDTRMSLRVWSPDAGIPVRLKVEDSSDPNKSVETEATVTTAAGWQTLIFNFSNHATGTSALNLANNYNKASVFFDFGRAKSAAVSKTYYFDDLSFVPGAAGGGGGACGTTVPTCAPTTTTPAGATVIYTDAASIAGLAKNPDWGQNPAVVFSEPTIAGNKSLKYTFGGTALYEGIDWSGTPQNVSSKSMLHLDFFSPDITSVKVSIISAGKENAVTKAVTPGSWNAIDIDMALYNVPDKNAIIQIKLEVNTAGTLYVDNIYFYTPAGSGASCGTTEPTCAPTTTTPAGATVIYTDAASIAGLAKNPDWGQNPAVIFSEPTIAGNKSLKYTFGGTALYEGIDWAGTPQNVSTKSMLHLDFFSPDITSVKVSIISAGKENAVTKAVTPGSWNAIDIDMALYNVPDKNAIIQIKLEPNKVGTLYVDNIFFYTPASSGASCGTTAPTCAPTTTIPAGSTVIYSDAASVAGLNKNPDWGQNPAVVFSEPTIAGNKSLKYTFGGTALYEGIDWAGSPQDVSGKGNLHLDFFSPDITSVKVSIISAGKENFVTKAVTPGSWNSIDIDMALYTVPVKTAIIQIKLEPNVAGTLYVDNIYFSGTAAASGGAGSCTAGVLMGAGGAQTLTLSTGDSKGIFAAGEALFAFDYKGSLDSLGNFAGWAGGRSDGTPSCGEIGYFNDTAMSNSPQKLDEGGWIVGTSLDAGGTPNFFRYFVLTAPSSTFSSSYIGLYANAPNNGTLNVSTFGSIKFRFWGPAEQYQQSNLNPVIEMVLSGPKVAGCTTTGSGGTEITKNFTASQKIGAGSAYKVALAGFTVKGVCGTDTNATAVASVLANLARVAFTVPASSFNFVNANPGATPSWSSGLNLGPIGFTNN